MAKLGEESTMTTTQSIGFTMSAAETASNVRLLLLGPPKNGKTVCAATVSKYFPESLPAQNMTVLHDVAWLLFDSGGLDGFAELGLNVPKIDLSNITELRGLQEALRGSFVALTASVESGTTKTVVVDTLSAFDKVLLTALSMTYDKWGLYKEVLNKHMQFYMKLKNLACNVVFICHGKAIYKGGDENNAQRAGAIPGMADIQPDITGQALNHYRGGVSMILPVVATKVGNITEYSMYPYGFKGFEAGSRFRNLDKKEPAHLGKLLAKIRANQPQ